MEKWDLKLDKYNISKHRYRELYNFCLQYPEFVDERQECYLLNGVNYDKAAISKDSLQPSNITAKRAERACALTEKIELIEKTAGQTDAEMAPYILKAVTQGLTWELMQPPCGKNQFYKMRRNFFVLLSTKR